MSVISMKKLTVIAHRKDTDTLIRQLMRTRCVDIVQTDLSQNERKLSRHRCEEEIAALEAQSAAIATAITALSPHSTRKKSLFTPRPLGDAEQFCKEDRREKTLAIAESPPASPSSRGIENSGAGADRPGTGIAASDSPAEGAACSGGNGAAGVTAGMAKTASETDSTLTAVGFGSSNAASTGPVATSGISNAGAGAAICSADAADGAPSPDADPAFGAARGAGTSDFGSVLARSLRGSPSNLRTAIGGRW